MPRREVPVLEDLNDAGASQPGGSDARGPRRLRPALRRAGALHRRLAAEPGWQPGVRAHWRVFTSQRAPGKLKYLAGSETAYGAFINDVFPEDAAQALRRSLA